jgi:hypothetical protein
MCSLIRVKLIKHPRAGARLKWDATSKAPGHEYSKWFIAFIVVPCPDGSDPIPSPTQMTSTLAIDFQPVNVQPANV